ncbi:MAG TPA: class I SAM-dependent methyltransferase [Acidimicrobiales bacterium]|nr:class I SAM-dependent methyltransferase [Acidimicrobiales bacterium]
MYEHSPAAYDALHYERGKDYRREAEAVVSRIRRHRPDAASILDVGCGTGMHLAAFARMGFDVEGVEPAPEMLAVAAERVAAPLHQGDMRTFRLDRRFDGVVCLFSAIGYMTTLDDLATALGRMGDHLVDGGVLVVEPWFTPDRWIEGTTDSESTTSGELAVARVSRSWREGDESLIEMRYALARPERTWSFIETHRMGLFTVEQQLEAYEAAGFDVEHEMPGFSDRGLFVAVKRATAGPRP